MMAVVVNFFHRLAEHLPISSLDYSVDDRIHDVLFIRYGTITKAGWLSWPT